VIDLDVVAGIADEAEAEDGAAPLDEATWRALRHRPETVRSWSTDDGVALLIGDEMSLVVRPDARGRGVGGELLADALPAGPVSAWSHGDHPAAAALARRHGFERVRSLWVMRRPTSTPLPDLAVPAGVTIRGYTPRDADELTRVNAAAFAHHPEQGAITEDDLRQRIAEPWFDPLGFFLAIRDAEVIGFHWTKVHPATPTQPDPMGEVYAVGVAPNGQGLGLGKALTTTGLLHLRGLGMREVLLYVDGDNTAAIALYEKLDFTRHTLDVMYER